MNKFGTPEVRKLSGHAWVLTQDWDTPFGVIPAGFVTDGASIPRVVWSFSHPAAEFFEAAVIHDWMYDNAIQTKAYADRVFRDVALLYGAKRWKVGLAYRAVKRFGIGAY